MLLRMELFVEDMKESVNFYTEVLGFTKTIESDNYISLRNGNTYIGLGPVSKLEKNHYLKPNTKNERKGVCVEIVLVVDEIEEYYKKIIYNNYPIHTKLTSRPWRATDFRIVDPDGYYIRITGSSNN